VFGLPLSWQLTRPLEVPEAFRLPEVPKLLGVPEYNNPRLYSILLLYSLTYNNGLFKQVDNYTILPLRHYVNSLIDPDKINKFLKV